ncbi:guanine nucleotide-releasing factor 2 isoform X3 [Bacillus rossius redtenbacheri]|uniref:guanine nucleotide-releasing factor 2 isoform X3 n=1 Tax=Bacillus rossius redtenbacheri TaxID=93214 RepID=UPI002FDCA483
MPLFDDGFLDGERGGLRAYRVGAPRRPWSTPEPALLSVLPLSPEPHDHDDPNDQDADSAAPKPRGGKLARRARSFKEDFLEILSQMRSPGGGSPHSPKTRAGHKGASIDAVDLAAEKNPVRDLDRLVKQVQFALKHFRDVVSKNKLEVLPGNGTVVLETITTIHGVLKTYVLNDQSSTLVSATNQVYQSLAKLIKLCDDVLLHGEKALDKENVSEVVQLVDEAVQNLVSLAQDKIANREASFQSANSHGLSRHVSSLTDRASGHLASADHQRSSLPDIPLTPRERQILAQTSSCTLEEPLGRGLPHSQSSESVLDAPPPKPPRPARSHHLSESSEPPPLPPKRRQRPAQACPDDAGALNGSGRSSDRASLRSKSPEDTSSLLSASAGSLDSVVSRDEEEIQALMDPLDEPTFTSDNILSQASSLLNGSSPCCWESASNTSAEQPASRPGPPSPLCSSELAAPVAPGSITGLDAVVVKQERLSSATESGFASMHSLRSSGQSYTASSVSSQQFCSSQQSGGGCETWQVHSASSSSSSTFVATTTQRLEVCEAGPEASPPALPRKMRSSRRHRQLSQYDNVPAEGEGGDALPEEERVLSCSLHQAADGKPPPLPLKKKHIMAYMEMFGNCSHANTNEFLRHSVHTYNLLQAEWQQREISLTSTQSCSFSVVSSHSSQVVSGPAPGPELGAPADSSLEEPALPREVPDVPPALPPKRSRTSSVKSAASPPPLSPVLPSVKINHVADAQEYPRSRVKEDQKWPAAEASPLPPPLGSSTPCKAPEATPEPLDECSLLEQLDIAQYLVYKKGDEEGPDIRGGHPDALIIHATKANKNDFLYQEAFLTTYRTFLSPLELIRKLCHRHKRFSCSSDPVKQRAAREAFSLLVRVVSDLTISDLDETVLHTLVEFVYQLLCSGDLTMAKALRVKIIERFTMKRLCNNPNTLLSSLNVYTRQSSLLDFKSEQIAEQMTLLDANLFMKIEIPEVLIWAQEQNEERSPNLTRFTEHFNKMSYWARSRILEQGEAKDRERYVVKFIKIMKHLRKINNFNSYLALLSALDSAPIRRLEWQKQITEGLKEYCALIDSSSSFRAYRQALAETQPPCIPYIGLVLQDLTFVHIGNSDLIPDGSINFSKRWQQFNIVENMKRFKKGSYTFKKHERIIAFFSNFDDFLCEEAMWQISESIKPRGGKRLQT